MSNALKDHAPPSVVQKEAFSFAPSVMKMYHIPDCYYDCLESGRFPWQSKPIASVLPRLADNLYTVMPWSIPLVLALLSGMEHSGCSGRTGGFYLNPQIRSLRFLLDGSYYYARTPTGRSADVRILFDGGLVARFLSLGLNVLEAHDTSHRLGSSSYGELRDKAGTLREETGMKAIIQHGYPFTPPQEFDRWEASLRSEIPNFRTETLSWDMIFAPCSVPGVFIVDPAFARMAAQACPQADHFSVSGTEGPVHAFAIADGAFSWPVTRNSFPIVVGHGALRAILQTLGIEQPPKLPAEREKLSDMDFRKRSCDLLNLFEGYLP